MAFEELPSDKIEPLEYAEADQNDSGHKSHFGDV